VSAIYGTSVICAILLGIAGCSTTTQQSATVSGTPESIPNPMPHIADCGIPNHPPCHPEVHVGQYGIGCKTYEKPTLVGPPSYSLSDIGRLGVPRLSREQVSLARQIQRYVRSRTLRFAIVGPIVARGAFLVFDAIEGPCFDGAPGYLLLNDSSGNSFYQPGEAPGYVHAGPGDVRATPGPWCRHRPGVAPCD